MRRINPRLLIGGLLIVGGFLSLLDVMGIISNAGGIFWGLRLWSGRPGLPVHVSLELAHGALTDFPDGVFFVALAPLDDASHIASATIQALGYTDNRNRSALDMLKHGIGDKEMLLVLDNCEHLIEDIAPLVSGLLSACPRLKILATSRESLRIPGEWLYPVPPLEIPAETTAIDFDSVEQYPALTLFIERTRAVRH